MTTIVSEHGREGETTIGDFWCETCRYLRVETTAEYGILYLELTADDVGYALLRQHLAKRKTEWYHCLTYLQTDKRRGCG